MGRLAQARARDDSDDGRRGRDDLVTAVMGGPDVLAVVDRDGTVRASGGGGEHALAPGANVFDAVHPDDSGQAAAFLATVAQTDPGDGPRGPVGWRLGREAPRHVEATAINRLGDPRVRGIVLSLRDVDGRAELEAQLRHSALHDPLTDLPNRALFYDRLEQALAEDGQTVALLYLDLDGFKAVNDRLGHHLGDAVLVEVASLLRGSLRGEDTAGRLGGDEFGVLLVGVSGSNDAVQAAQRLLALFSEPLPIVDPPVVLRPSIGVAVLAAREAGPDELLRRADVAMISAKREGRRHWALYDPTEESPSGVRRRRLGGWFARSHEQRDEVADVLDRSDALVAALQPIMDLRTGLVAGYEALARFPRHPGRQPTDWFAQAHRCGLGFELEARAIAAALSIPDRPPNAFLSLNVSPSAFGSAPVQEVLPAHLDSLVLEITENEHVSDDRRFHAMRESLRARGGRLAVDDTGAGYAGLRQLMRLQPDVLKLDRSVVDGVAGDRAKAALIEAMVRYADRIGAVVCAEGIETLADLDALAELDVAYGQGWVIGRPAASWVGVSPEAAARCRDAYSASVGGASRDEAFAMAHERRLEWLTWKLSEAAGYGDLAAAVESVARDLHADDVALSVLRNGELVLVGERGVETAEERFRVEDFPQTTRVLTEQVSLQVLASDPGADPAELEVLARLGMGSVLMLPVVCAGRTIGLLEAYSVRERPFSRYEMGRARIVAFQIGAALERLRRLGA